MSILCLAPGSASAQSSGEGLRVQASDGGILRFDAEREAWVADASAPADRYVVEDAFNRIRYELDLTGRVTQHVVRSGESRVLMNPQEKGSAERVVQMQLDGTTLYMVTEDRLIFQVTADDPQPRQVGINATKPYNTRIAATDGVVFALQQNGSVSIFRNDRWSKANGVASARQLAALDGKLYYLTTEGKFFSYQPGSAAPELLLTDAGLSQIAAENGKLYALHSSGNRETLRVFSRGAFREVAALPAGRGVSLVPRSGNLHDVRPVTVAAPAPAQASVPAGPSGAYQPASDRSLDKYGELLTEKLWNARGAWKDILGRDKDVLKLEDGLLGIEKNNVLVVSEPGVGKTALVELLAQRILNGQVMPEFRSAEILMISEGTFNVGGPADNLKQVKSFIQDVERFQASTRKPVILFFDEQHTISKSVAQELKKYLDGRNQIYWIGSTTLDEARELEKDRAFVRRFKVQLVRELTKEETFKVLRESWAPRLEKRYSVTISDEAIREAIELNRYYADRVRPDGPQDILKFAAIQAYRARVGARRAAAPVTEESVRNYVAADRNLPIATLTGEAVRTYGRMEQELAKSIFNQPEAIRAIANARRLKVTGVADPNRPTVVALLGLTGTGKSEIARELAAYEFSDRERVFEISMTEFTNEGKLNTLVGSPNGYRDSESSGRLVRFLKNNPAGVIVINEFMKADGPVRNWLYEVLDTGRVEGGDGKLYSLKEFTVILTDNAGEELLTLRRANGEMVGEAQSAEELLQRYEKLAANREALKVKLTEAILKKGGTDALVARLNDVVLMRPHSKESLANVAGKYLEQLAARMVENRRFEIRFSDALKEYLGTYDYTVEQGARNVRSVVDSLVGAPLGNAILKAAESGGSLGKGDALVADIVMEGDGAKITFTRKGQARAFYEETLPKNKVDLARTLKGDQAEKLRGLEAALAKGYYGQPEAVRAVANALREKVSPWAPAKEGPAVVTLLGLPGTGKTHLGGVVAREWYGNGRAVFDFDMGRIQDYANMNLLLGSPNGYVDSDKGGALIDFLQRHPDGGVIVLNEIDQAGGRHDRTQVQKMLYDLLLTGEVVDGHGRTHSAKNHLIILTTNTGEKLFNLGLLPNDGVASEEYLKRRYEALKASDIDQALRESFTDAFIRRMGHRVLMRPLLTDALKRIVALEIESHQNFFRSKGVEVSVDPKLVDLIVAEGFRPREGASPVKNLADAFIKTAVIQAGDEGRLRAGDRITVGVDTDMREVVLSRAGARRTSEEILRVPVELRTVASPEAEAKLRKALAAVPEEYRGDRALWAIESTAGMERAGGLFASGAYNLLTDRFIISEAEILKLSPVELEALVVHETVHRKDALAARQWVTPEQYAALASSSPGVVEWAAYRAQARYLRERGAQGKGGAVVGDAETLSREEFIRKYNESHFKPWMGPRQRAAFEASLRAEAGFRQLVSGVNFADEYRYAPASRRAASAPAARATTPATGPETGSAGPGRTGATQSNRVVRSAKTHATREAREAGRFAAAWMLKEGIKAVEAGDVAKMSESAKAMATYEFWGSLGAFTAGARASERVLMMQRVQKRMGPVMRKLMPRVAPLTAGMLAAEASTGHVDPKRLALSTSVFLGLGAAFEAPLHMRPIAAVVNGLGPRAKFAIQLSSFVGTLYFAEKIELQVLEQLEREPLDADTRAAVEEYKALVREGHVPAGTATQAFLKRGN